MWRLWLGSGEVGVRDKAADGLIRGWFRELGWRITYEIFRDVIRTMLFADCLAAVETFAEGYGVVGWAFHLRAFACVVCECQRTQQ
jgi:hypothetical protein